MNYFSFKNCMTFCIIVLILFSGCLNIGKNETVNQQQVNYDFFVNLRYDENISGWNQTHFKTIQDALKKSDDNQTIFVFNGTYFENILIDKDNIVLTGENPYTTIVDGLQKDDVVSVFGTGHQISGFTFMNSSKPDRDYHQAGIDLRSKKNEIVNNIFSKNTCGIYARYADDNIISKNLFLNSTAYGAFFDVSSERNNVSNNVFTNNSYALRIKGSNFCNVTFNGFLNNEHGVYLCCGTKYTILFGNIFSKNQEWNAADHYDNHWDNVIPAQWVHINATQREFNERIGNMGNFWDTYHLETQGAYDNDSDNIIDTPYDIPDVDADDQFPLKKKPAIHNPFITDEEISKYMK